jgi:hypothetical protein
LLISILLSLGCVGIGLLPWLAYRRVVFRRRAMSLAWPRGLPAVAAARYAEYYLRRRGWQISSDAPRHLKVLVSAGKGPLRANIFILQPGVLPIRTQLRDADVAANALGQTITAVAYDMRVAELQNFEIAPRVLVIEPFQLGRLEEFLRARYVGMGSATSAAGMAPPNPAAQPAGLPDNPR